MCCDSWGHKESDMTEQLNGTELNGRQVASQLALVLKTLLASAGEVRGASWIPGLGISPGGGHSNPLQYFAWRIPWTEEPGQL